MRIAHADNLSEEREHEHSTIAVPVYVGDLSSLQPARARTSIGARRCEHVAPGTKQRTAGPRPPRRGMARTMSRVVRGFKQNVALKDSNV